MQRLSSHIFAACIEEDLILFDSRADRYLALPGAVAAAGANDVDLGLPGFRLLAEGVQAMEDAGYLEARADGRTAAALARPQTAAAQNLRPIRIPRSDRMRFAVAAISAGWQVRRGRSCSHYRSTRRCAEGRVPADLVDALARLRAARLVIPSARRCLPASIAAARFLQGLGHGVEIVFAVRSHPFAAHCWIETNGVVLDDDLDRVRAFTPIAVGTL